jgi:hypothetical protein
VYFIQLQTLDTKHLGQETGGSGTLEFSATLDQLQVKNFHFIQRIHDIHSVD